MEKQNGLNTLAIALVGLISSILVFELVLLMAVFYHRVEERQEAENDSGPPSEVTALIHRQEVSLTEAELIDEEKGIYTIPIKLAMKKVVTELSGNTAPEDAKEDERVP